jgi:lipopolysaccharide export system protein LptA
MADMKDVIRITVIGASIAFALVAPSVIPPAPAQAPASPAASGPIDIQANEQEFSGDQVIARGNVRVTYKGSVILAPSAQLFRDPGGNPQKAIFTGHPHLTQSDSKMDAETLTFEIANSRIIAEGRAHSEVISASEEKKPDAAGGATSGLPLGGDKKPEKPGEKVVEKIITDADRQEYDKSTGKFEAIGHVHVVHGEILVKADKLQLVYGVDGKPETALFTGNVAATQNRNTTCSDSLTYSLSTKRLQASGHVKSTVIQEQKPKPTPIKKADAGDVLIQVAAAAEIIDDAGKDDVVVITSESQEYTKDGGRMAANGNVRVYYEDMMGAGPACVLTTNAQGKADKIIFSGRSQICQPTKRWIADHIEMTIADKKVLASGNTRAMLLSPVGNKRGAPLMPAPQTQLAKTNTQSVSDNQKQGQKPL